MLRPSILVGLTLATAALAGCVSTPSAPSPGPGAPPNYGCCFFGPDFGDAFGAIILLVILALAAIAITVVALVFLAILAPGPASQVASALLIAVGAIVALLALGGGGVGGFLLGVALAAVGVACVLRLPRKQEATRTIVLDER